jgi:hypothetical protein
MVTATTATVAAAGAVEMRLDRNPSLGVGHVTEEEELQTKKDRGRKKMGMGWALGFWLYHYFTFY